MSCAGSYRHFFTIGFKCEETCDATPRICVRSDAATGDIRQKHHHDDRQSKGPDEFSVMRLRLRRRIATDGMHCAAIPRYFLESGIDSTEYMRFQACESGVAYLTLR